MNPQDRELWPFEFKRLYIDDLVREGFTLTQAVEETEFVCTKADNASLFPQCFDHMSISEFFRILPGLTPFFFFKRPLVQAAIDRMPDLGDGQRYILRNLVHWFDDVSEDSAFDFLADQLLRPNGPFYFGLYMDEIQRLFGPSFVDRLYSLFSVPGGNETLYSFADRLPKNLLARLEKSRKGEINTDRIKPIKYVSRSFLYDYQNEDQFSLIVDEKDPAKGTMLYVDGAPIGVLNTSESDPNLLGLRVVRNSNGVYPVMPGMLYAPSTQHIEIIKTARDNAVRSGSYRVDMENLSLLPLRTLSSDHPPNLSLQNLFKFRQQYEEQ